MVRVYGSHWLYTLAVVSLTEAMRVITASVWTIT